MRVLLDECLPRGLARDFPGHEVRIVSQIGWSGIKNGELLRRAAQGYDAIITIDQRFAEGEQVPPSLLLILLRARSNRLESLRPLVPKILAALAGGRKGERVRVAA